MKKIIISILLVLTIGNLVAQTTQTETKKEAWHDKISIRGYSQIRYNRILETNPSLINEQGDRSIGQNGGFFIRRARLIFFGQVNKRVYFYIQPDLAASPSSDRLHFVQLRDLYFDLGLDNSNEFRLRIGQSKVPYGFENLQSSQNRLTLDRNDALNSAVPNERDLGVMFYWAPSETRKLFSELVNSGLKGSGDYGVFGLGLYNGQTANAPEANNNSHVVGRVSVPFKIQNQIVEMSVQGYEGQFTLNKSNLSSGVKYRKDLTYTDRRLAGSFVIYPKPFGLQAEYNIGQGPQFNKLTDSIEVRNLKGGYVQTMYMVKIGHQNLIPFIKYQWYQGGKKAEKDARSYDLSEVELGVEWQVNKNFELTTNWTYAERRFEDFGNQDNLQRGSFLRVQAQLNF